MFVSAKTKQRVNSLFEQIQLISENHALRIQSSVLNEVIEDAVARNPAPTDKGNDFVYITLHKLQLNHRHLSYLLMILN